MSKKPPGPDGSSASSTCSTAPVSCSAQDIIQAAEEAADDSKGSHVSAPQFAGTAAAEDELSTWLQDPLELAPLENRSSSDNTFFPQWPLTEAAFSPSLTSITTASSAATSTICANQLITTPPAFRYSPQLPLQELPDWIHRDALSMASTGMLQSGKTVGDCDCRKGNLFRTSNAAAHQQSSSAHQPVWPWFHRRPSPTLKHPYLQLQAEGKLINAALNSGSQRRAHRERLPEGTVPRMVGKKGSMNAALRPLPQGEYADWMSKESSHMQIVGPFNCIANEGLLEQTVQSEVSASKEAPQIGDKGWQNKAAPWPSITSFSGPEERGNWLKQQETASKPSVTIGRGSLQTDVSNSAAEEALTLGASRAAGIIEPSFDEAFSRVRTSLQPQQARLGSSSVASHASFLVPEVKQPFSQMAANSPMLPPRIKTFGSYRSMLSSQTASRTDPKLLSLSSTNETTITPGTSQDSKQCIKFKTIVRGTSSKHGSLESSATDVLASEESGRSSPVIAHLQPDAEHMQEGVGADVGSGGAVLIHPHEKKTECHDVHSGGSHTNENIREALPSGKRKPEDSEGQSEEAEGESALNSQTKTSTPKRTRANEVHNLSERRRRTRINDKMNALRELVPNASKTNKAALLDEAIEYIKMLQLQLQVMSMRTGISMSPAYPSGLSHAQSPPINPAQSLGMGLSGGYPAGVAEAIQNKDLAMAEMIYGAPARPLLNLSPPLPGSTTSLTQFRALSTSGSTPNHFPHSQALPSSNVDIHNPFLQQHQQLEMLKQQQSEQLHQYQQQEQSKLNKQAQDLSSKQHEQEQVHHPKEE